MELMNDGTLVVSVEDATKVTRVLVEDGKNGDLYYADRPQIVRCGECKHWRAYETWSECELWTDDPYKSAKTKPDDFCSYGEREDE